MEETRKGYERIHCSDWSLRVVVSTPPIRVFLREPENSRGTDKIVLDKPQSLNAWKETVTLFCIRRPGKEESRLMKCCFHELDVQERKLLHRGTQKRCPNNEIALGTELGLAEKIPSEKQK